MAPKNIGKNGEDKKAPKRMAPKYWAEAELPQSDDRLSDQTLSEEIDLLTCPTNAFAQGLVWC